MRYVILCLVCLGLYLDADPQSPDAANCEPVGAACIFEAAWGAALLLPEDKQERLIPVFLETVALTEDANLLSKWQSRHRVAKYSPPAESYPDYGWQIAEPIVAEYGIAGLIDRSEKRAPPLHFGRSDALHSAGLHYLLSRPDSAARLNTALIELIADASDFEKPSLASAAAHLAVRRCDRTTFETAIQHVDAADSLQYAFWRARFDQDLTALPTRIRDDAIDDDTRHVRQVLDGYRLILEHGFCPDTAIHMGN